MKYQDIGIRDVWKATAKIVADMYTLYPWGGRMVAITLASDADYIRLRRSLSLCPIGSQKLTLGYDLAYHDQVFEVLGCPAPDLTKLMKKGAKGD